MNLFTGLILQDEKHSCNCGKYDGHQGWRCNHCGEPILIEGKARNKDVVCYRIPPEDLEEGMYLFTGEHFYKVLHIFDPVDEKRMYVNLQGFGSYPVSLSSYLLVMYM